MSRWHEAHELHSYRKSWAALKSEIDNLDLEDDLAEAAAPEVARARKVIGYVDGLFEGVEPELVPLVTWDKIDDAAQKAQVSLTAFAEQGALGPLQAVNTSLDSILGLLRPYSWGRGGVAKAMRKAAKAYASAVAAHLAEFESESRSKLDEIAGRHQSAGSFLEEMESKSERISEIYDDLLHPERGLHPRFQRYFDEVSSYRDALLEGDGEDPGIKEQISEAVDEVAEFLKSSRDAAEEHTDLLDELRRFHLKVYGRQQEDGARVGGLSAELEAKKNKIDSLTDEQDKRISALALRVEELLPGATSAGMASAYREMRERFDKPLRYADIAFYVAIGGLFVVSSFLGADLISDAEPNWEGLINSMLLKLPLAAPLIWLGVHASKRRSQMLRLQQEYAHKEALASSYDSYRTQITELGEDSSEMLQALIAKAVDAASYNASVTLDGKHGSGSIVECVSSAAGSMGKGVEAFRARSSADE